MLTVLALGSAVSLQSTLITVAADHFKTWKYWQLALIGCISGFLMGLVYITQVKM
jgi:hypothetical protein